MSVLTEQTSALEQANKVRLAKAAFRAELRSLSPAESAGLMATALEDVPWWLEHVRIGAALTWVRQFRSSRVQKLLGSVGVHEHRPIGRWKQGEMVPLTAHERLLIADSLRRVGR